MYTVYIVYIAQSMGREGGRQRRLQRNLSDCRQCLDEVVMVCHSSGTDSEGPHFRMGLCLEDIWSCAQKTGSTQNRVRGTSDSPGHRGSVIAEV